jgi:hypothetical protein
LDLVWDKLLSAFQPKPLPEDAAEHGKLTQTLADLNAYPAKKGK